MNARTRTHAGAALAAGLVLAGAAHADGTWLGSSFCRSTANSSGSPATMAMFGPDHAGSGLVYMEDPVVLSAGPVPAAAPGIFIYSQNAAQVPFGDGYLCLTGSIWRLPAVASSGAGLFEQPITFRDHPGFVPGDWKVQCWFRDPLGGPAGFNLSDGLAFTIAP